MSETIQNSSPERKGPGRPLADPDRADWAIAFIDALVDGLTVRDAARRAGVDQSMPYVRRKVDEEFRLAWYEARDIGTTELEQEAARRAYHGTLKPVFHKGVECGQIREYSDTLMIFLLKARKPEVYREGIGDGTSSKNVTLNVNVVNVEGDSLLSVQPALNIVEVTSKDISSGSKQDDQGLPEATPVSGE